ncbi:LacI family DNA-binding transcriptional regulator [Arthrobacter sp. NPDC090010]|uniref:LacI family DNA-binding transcriptional regulator n=1 Tax=Arthrobacter sp. NPDC090010 TaxID=3363942 RepID=UPI0038042045
MPRTSPDRVPTQGDVAKLAKVSAQTVSRVMTGSQKVHPDTERRVREAVDLLGYRVHGAAAALATGRTRLLGVIVVSTTQYSSSAIGVGIEMVAAAHGYTVTTAAVSNHSSASAFITAFERLERQGAEGVIIVAPVDVQDPGMIALMKRTPTVQIEGRSQLGRDGRPGSTAEQEQAQIARSATEHLLQLGHETVWHVSGDEDWLESGWRLSAWQEALRERGINPPPVVHGDWTPESGYRAGRALAADPGVTAVFVSSDEMAFGVIRALHEAGRRVPQDISVVSVDDIALAEYASPALTTVRQPFADRGRAAAQQVIALIDGAVTEPFVPALPELVVRASTAPPPGR